MNTCQSTLPDRREPLPPGKDPRYNTRSMKSDGKPLIVQGDGSLLLDVHDASFDESRAEISAYAELEKSPEHVHTYRISPLSLWNAAGAGWDEAMVQTSLDRWSRYPIPEIVARRIADLMGRWGSLRLRLDDSGSDDTLRLEVDDPALYDELKARKALKKWLLPEAGGFRIRLVDRGTVKAELIRIGYPVDDRAPLRDGEPLDLKLRNVTVRDYQLDALEAFVGHGRAGTGFGTVVMPCGSGKTVVGIAAMARIGMSTLILTTNVAAVHQWRNELLDKTSLESEAIAEYTGDRKEVGPVTVATYQILTWRPDRGGPYPHFDLFRRRPWGLIIYDEVHLLPAPVFRVTAEIQAVRRLGLTATLIREDGAERDVFSLVGPKRFDIPWKELESSGWIAEARCREIRINLPPEARVPYAMAEKRRKVRLAAENPRKIDIALQLVKNRHEDQILVIG